MIVRIKVDKDGYLKLTPMVKRRGSKQPQKSRLSKVPMGTIKKDDMSLADVIEELIDDKENSQ